MDRIDLAVQAAGPVRTVNHDGREFRVVPAVLVQSQVLQNNLGRTFLPPEAITDEWARASNDAPVVLDHPTSRGMPVSAKTPEVLNARGLGRVYNVRVENGALKGDVFLDTSRKAQVPELGTILASLESGQPTELSTGFPVLMERAPGVHNGEAFDIRITPAGPLDHLAVFADKLGACSVRDGCGLGVNHAGACDAPEVTDPTSVLTTSPEVPEPAANESGNHHPKESRMDREKLIAQLAAAGEDKEALNRLSDCALNALASAGAQPEQPSESEAMKLAQQYKKRAEELERRYEPVVQNWERERVRLLDDVLSVSGRPWTDEQCINMEFEELRRVHQALCQRADYSLSRGAAFGQPAFSQEIKPFFGVGSAFNAKEA